MSVKHCFKVNLLYTLIRVAYNHLNSLY